MQDYRRLKKTAEMKSQRLKELIPSMTDSAGVRQNERQSIADVFAAFYEELYKDAHRHTRPTNDTTAPTTHHINNNRDQASEPSNHHTTHDHNCSNIYAHDSRPHTDNDNRGSSNTTSHNRSNEQIPPSTWRSSAVP